MIDIIISHLQAKYRAVRSRYFGYKPTNKKHKTDVEFIHDCALRIVNTLRMPDDDAEKERKNVFLRVQENKIDPQKVVEYVNANLNKLEKEAVNG